MRAGRSKDIAAIVALMGAVAWGTWLLARQGLELNASWTDGIQRYRATDAAGIRFAVWDDARPLTGAVNEEDGAESRPALSPDGRFLVFAAGERGLGADLWIAELVGNEPAEPRPLVRVNTAADELAPAFGHDALYFASDRTGEQFGLDLWRVPYFDGVFGEPEAVGPGVNTAADETDPAPVPGTSAVLFASNRSRAARTDYDLFHAVPAETEEGDRTYEVFGVDALNTPWDERDPAVTPDGRTVLFASNRDGSRGGFDLYKSFDEGEGWLPPAPLVGVNTVDSERGPLPSRDGFTLLFDARNGQDAPDLWRANSLELFRVPQPPLSWRDALILFLLLLLAILAWLAKRWHTIDVLYRCILVSLLLHMLLMWWLRDVVPESEPVVATGEDQLFRVRLASVPAGEVAANQERGGQVDAERTMADEESAPARTATEVVEVADAAPSTRSIEIAERGEEAAPARESAELEDRRAETEVEASVEERELPFERYDAGAPALAVNARRDTVTPASRPTSGTPRKSETQSVTETEVAPHEMALAAAPAPGDAPTAETTERERVAHDADTFVPTTVEVATPSERFARESGTAPSLVLPDASTFEAPQRGNGEAPDRAEGTRPSPVTTRDAAPLAENLRGLEPASRPNPELAGPPRRDLQEAPARTADPTVAVRDVDEPTALGHGTGGAPSTRFDPTTGLAGAVAESTGRSTTSTDVLPDRFARESPTSGPVRPDRLRPGAAPTPDDDAPTRRNVVAPTAGSRDHEVATRALDDPVLVRPGTDVNAPARFDPTAGLATSIAAPAPRSLDGAPTPRRFETERTLDGPARPERLELTAAAPPATPATDEAPRLEHTPYQNRFGDEKLRALEEYGGGVETERAVAMGLAYLASIQHRRGFWGETRDYDRDKYQDVRIGKTGLAMLAFLGAGHTPDSATEHADVTRRAIEFLLREQHDNGHIGDGSAYGHGIATYALAEAFAMTQDPALRAPLELAVSWILTQQKEDRDARFHGGWGYYFADGHVWERDRWPRVSVTAWQVMALESARLGGLEVPDEAFADAGLFLAKAYDARREAFRYSHDPSRLSSGYPILPASTPAAMFALSLLGVDLNSDELAPARRFVLERAPHDYRYRSDDAFVNRAVGNLYFWYYATLAMFRAGGDAWDRWNTAMKETLLDGQSEDGSWRPISIYARYAGDDDDERTYTTAINVLTLEVYYRYFTPLLKVR